MAFRFFRPWEDDWRPSTRQTVASNHGAPAKDSTTNNPSQEELESSDQAEERRPLSGKEIRMTDEVSDIYGTFSGVREKPKAMLTNVKSQKPKSSLDKTLSSEGSPSIQKSVVPLPEMLSPTPTDATGVLGVWQNDTEGHPTTSADKAIFPFDISTASRTSSSSGIISNETNNLQEVTICKSSDESEMQSTNQQEKPSSLSFSKALENDSKCSRGERHEQTLLTSNDVPKQESHTAGKPFKCELCEKAFPTGQNMLIHERTHTGSTPFKCTSCGKAFAQSDNRRRHQRVHTRSRPSKCTSCKKAFYWLSHLHEHERIHTGSKLFKCTFCGRNFTRQSNLHGHERIHIGSKPFKCTVCEKAFQTSSHFRYHERTHTGSKPFKCSICEKAFTQSSMWHVHERYHTGSKPFKCTVCGKAFTINRDLHRHERIHTGSKPFKCNLCGKAFALNGNLRRHERTHK